MFSEPQNLKEAKANEIENKQLTGVINSYCSDSYGVVLNITIDVVEYQMVLTELTGGMQAHHMKTRAKSGIMGCY